MELKTSLEHIERYSAKLWRLHCKQHKDNIILSFNEYDYLKVIQYAEKPLRLTDIAAQLEVSKPSASNMIVRLESRGLVSRKQSSEDARVSHITLTDKAVQLMQFDDVIYASFANEIEKVLTKKECQQLEGLLAKLFTQLKP
ncbi:hypothetical protein A3K86_21050 [Photobacterium jeanii]|uniref:HTH marR-type domain-containing protein n=1 Tax=Photobacterium jeanii TaxID=858640 RepID=A0A178K404_9GAMM|nr:MarR family transcriptional regulator [Photobacterium jeanii]OAN11433.1 hypothetical protein A3K86_21050 [Photobacterium jeanii]PST90953.1 MarR family transcriptional regulator [Photobacterium jeanii]